MKSTFKIGYKEVVILCVCKGVSEREVVDAIRCGARSTDDVARRCDGAGTDCGSCRQHIEWHLRGDDWRIGAA